MATERLHYDDPLRLEFDARVVAIEAFGGAPSVILDRTAFYPESGGQMGDRGEIAGALVRDVQVDDDGRVHHLLEESASAPAIGAEVHGRVDRARRRVHMALHTGQHMLSRALADCAGAATVSSRLGETACTIDVDRAAVEERLVAEAEDLVNAVVDDDVPVRAWFPDAGELAGLPLRREPKVTANVRVVAIGDFDVSPCGGTHCTRTAQVGLVRVTGIERYKGKIRVTFAAGRRALGELGREAELLRGLARDFTCGPLDVRAAIDKLRRELDAARAALGSARARLAERLATEAIASATAARASADEVSFPFVIATALDDADADLVRAVAGRIVARAPDACAAVAGRSADGLAVMIARGDASSVDCGAMLSRIARAARGRGGGRPERAEGRLPATTDWVPLVAAVLGDAR